MAVKDCITAIRKVGTDGPARLDILFGKKGRDADNVQHIRVTAYAGVGLRAFTFTYNLMMRKREEGGCALL